MMYMFLSLLLYSILLICKMGKAKDKIEFVTQYTIQENKLCNFDLTWKIS